MEKASDGPSNAGTDPVSHPLLDVRHLRRHFDLSSPLLDRLLEGGGRRTVQAVDGVSFVVPRGHTFALVGESGCGKSTAARLIVGLDRPDSGQVFLDGVDITGLSRSASGMRSVRRRLQMVFQDPYASLNPLWRVSSIIAEPLRMFGLTRGRAETLNAVGELLSQVGLRPEDGGRYPHEFSGGQRQRISIARALASRPEFLVCDEPTSALDVSVQAQILNLMKDLQQQHALTYLFISHDMAVVKHMSDQVGVMYLGRLCEVAPTATLFRQPQHPYTRMLIETIPDTSMSRKQTMPAIGELPDPSAPPPGCPFNPRCPFANDRCRTEPPALTPGRGGEGSVVACHAVDEGRLTSDTPAPAVSAEQ